MANVAPGKTQVGIVLTEAAARWLRRAAFESGRSLGEVVEDYLPTSVVEAERDAHAEERSR
jgi:hypothetical protein